MREAVLVRIVESKELVFSRDEYEEWLGRQDPITREQIKTTGKVHSVVTTAGKMHLQHIEVIFGGTEKQ